MQVSDIDWSKAEREIARTAFEKAYEREIKALIEAVRDRASAITKPDDMWQLHDFLSAKRHAIDGKYDYRYSMLIFVFAQLVKEGWLQLKELDGLGTDKLTKIAALTRV